MLKSLFENSRTAMIFAAMVLVCAALISGLRISDHGPGQETAPEAPAASATPTPAPSVAAAPGSRSDWYGPEPAIGQSLEDEDGENTQGDGTSSTAEGTSSDGSAPAARGPVYGPDGKVLALNPQATLVPGNDDD